MGLGKTLQVIARLLTEREEAADRPPTLIIAPTSVLSNWRKEIERFAPQLGVRRATDLKVGLGRSVC